MAAKNIFHKVIDQAKKEGFEKVTKTSIEWFRQNVRLIGKRKIDTNALILDKNTPGKKQRGMSSFRHGSMVLFSYDAKLKDELPYWDRFPLILLLSADADFGVDGKGGFLGLNLHYLPPKLRAVILSNLLDITTNKKYDESTRFRLTYDMVKDIGKYKILKPCIKRYLLSHVKSNFVIINPEFWLAAVFLPLANFQGASQTTVWADSAKHIK